MSLVDEIGLFQFEDLKKQVKEMQEQIAELNKKIEELKNGKIHRLETQGSGLFGFCTKHEDKIKELEKEIEGIKNRAILASVKKYQDDDLFQKDLNKRMEETVNKKPFKKESQEDAFKTYKSALKKSRGCGCLLCLFHLGSE